MRRGILAGAILATWVGSLGWLAARQARSGDQVGGLDDRLPPSDAYLAVRLGEEQIGILSGSLDTIPGGARTVERVDLVASGPDATSRRIIASDLRFGPGLALEQLSLIRGGEGDRLRLLAERDSAGRFTTRVTAGGDTASWHWPAPPRSTVRTVASALRFLGLTREPVGEPMLVLDPSSLDWDLFEGGVVGETTLVVPDSAAMDPATGQWVEARWDTLVARRIEYSVHGLPFDAWVDGDGNIVRVATPFGASIQRSAFEIVRQGYRPGAAAPARAGAPLLGPPAARPAVRFERLVVVLEGADTSLAAWQRIDLDAPFQRRRGDTLEVRAASPEVFGGPAPAGRTEPLLLLSSGAIPASHPVIVARARRIAGGGTDPAEVTRAVARWIGEQVVLDAAGPDHPVAALERRRASAAGRTALFLALTRALAVPARPVAGLRWDGQAFRYHGWAEVRLPGGWLPVDPALGQFPADGGRLRLATGVGADPGTLAPLIGRLRPRVLHVEPGR